MKSYISLNKDKILITFILLLAALLRFWNLDKLPLYCDEAYHYLSSSAIHLFGIPIMESGLVYTRSLPLLYLQALSTEVLGNNIFYLRLPSVIFGILSVAATYFFFKYRVRQAAVVIALFVAISPLAMFHSQNARMYELLLLCSLTVWALSDNYMRKGELRYLVGILLMIIITVTIHRLSIITLLGICFPAIFNPAYLIKNKIVIGALLPVYTCVWFGYYKYLLNIMFPIPEHIPITKYCFFIYPDFTMMEQIVNSSNIAPLLLILASVGVGSIVWLYRKFISSIDISVIILIVVSSVLQLMMLSFLIVLIYSLISIYRGDTSEIRLMQTRLYLSIIAMFIVVWIVLSSLLSDVPLTSLISRCLAYPKIFQVIVKPALRAGHHVDMLLFGGTIFLLVLFPNKIQHNLNRSAIAGLSMFVIIIFAVIGFLKSYYCSIRYFYFIYPCVIGVNVIILLQINKRILRFLSIASLITLFSINTYQYLNLQVGKETPYIDNRVIDFDSISKVLKEYRKRGDVVISTSSHRVAPYGGMQDGFIASDLHEYRNGIRHYITNAIILRTPEDMIDLIADTQGSIWMMVRLKSNLPNWCKNMFGRGGGFKVISVSRDGEVILYRTEKDELENALLAL